MLTDIARFFYPNLQQFRLDLENILLFSLKKFPEIKVKLFASYFNFKKSKWCNSRQKHNIEHLLQVIDSLTLNC